jgi:hypothetical protein
MPASEVIGLVEALGAPYGLERSVKITSGALADDRCLISVGREAFGNNPTERVMQMGNALHLPPSFADQLPISLAHADVVHFGYEAAAGEEIYKIYCEYTADVRRAMAAGNQVPVLVHLAYKWSASNSESRAITRYTWLPFRTRRELEGKLKDLVPMTEAPIAHRCTFDLISRVAAYADSGELLLMEVEEPGNPRRSCDLNVYDADLHMNEIADLLDAALRDFAVPKARAQSVFEPAKDRALGHLSAGVARNGREFVTIYFGVEAH